MPGRPQGAERGRPVFRDPFGEGREVFRRRPRVVGGGAALLAYQVVGPTAQDLAVEKLLHQRRPAPRRRRKRGPDRVGLAGPRENGRA